MVAEALAILDGKGKAGRVPELWDGRVPELWDGRTAERIVETLCKGDRIL